MADSTLLSIHCFLQIERVKQFSKIQLASEKEFLINWSGTKKSSTIFVHQVHPSFILSMKAREDTFNAGKIKLWKRRLESTLISLLLISALLLHAVGALSNDAWKWNEQPTDIDTHPDRLWDWRNPQFLS